MKWALSVLLCLCVVQALPAQELFPLNKPASVLPKDGLAIQWASHFYEEDGYLRYMQRVQFAYGMTSRWELALAFNGSNHNHPQLVSELFDADSDGHAGHNHGSDPDGGFNQEHRHPFKLNGAFVRSQYRFWTSDGPNTHLRAAGYGIFSSNWTSHHFSEPNLLHRNAGVGFGGIFTWLRKRLAVSGRLGAVLPFGYTERDSQRYFKSGNAMDYALSVGYLALPRKYKSYDNVNLNFYLEFMGKWHQAARMRDAYRWYPTSTFRETANGTDLDIRPGIQAIFASKLRLEVSTALPFLGRSQTMEYPQVQVNLQILCFP